MGRSSRTAHLLLLPHFAAALQLHRPPLVTGGGRVVWKPPSERADRRRFACCAPRPASSLDSPPHVPVSPPAAPAALNGTGVATAENATRATAAASANRTQLASWVVAPQNATKKVERKKKKKQEQQEAASKEKAGGPATNVALDGGDIWSGARASEDDIRALCDAAWATRVDSPVMAQYYPRRSWLWKRWRGTIVRVVLPRECLFNVAFAAALLALFGAPGLAGLHELRESQLGSVEQVWRLAAGIVSFSLSFFLSQAYSLWRKVYSLSRRVQVL